MIRTFSTRLLLLSLLAWLSAASLQAQGEFTLFFTGYVHGAHEPCG